jgi:hypothetical protein
VLVKDLNVRHDLPDDHDEQPDDAADVFFDVPTFPQASLVDEQHQERSGERHCPDGLNADNHIADKVTKILKIST